jgi:hypothetical protein
MPGETFGGDAHAPATREMVWVECARFPAGRPHRYANEGPDPVQLTMVVVVPPTEA